MKKLLFKSLMMMGAIFAAVTGLTSCGGSDDDTPEPTLSVSNPSISMDGTGGSVTFQVTSNTKWVASSGASWCTVSPQSGEGNTSVDVTASENTSTSSRKCTIRVRTTDGALSQDVTVEQSGAEASLSVTESLDFTSEKGNAKNLTIECNTEWKISGKPDWLDASDLSGKGDAKVTLTTLNANNTATQRTATLTVTAGTESKSVSVTQAAGLSSVSVTPTNIVVLEDAIAWDLSYSGNLKNFRSGIWKQTELNKLKDSQIIEKLEAKDATSYQENYIWSKSNLDNETTYVLCFLAYDKEDNRGELIKKAVTTRKHDNLAPTAEIDYLARTSNNYMHWSVSPSSKCSSFHMLYGVDISETAATRDPIVYAWIINNCVANGKSSIYSNTAVEANLLRQDDYYLQISAPLYQKTNCLVATWGKYSESEGGDYSPKITYAAGYFDAMSSSSKQNNMQKRSNSKSGTNKIKSTDLRAFKNLIVR